MEQTPHLGDPLSNEQQWAARGYDARIEGISSRPVACLLCGALVSTFQAPDGRYHYEVHDAWHEANDGR